MVSASIASALTPLAVLACPLGMGLMMWIMMRGSKKEPEQHPAPTPPPVSVEVLREEQRRLDQEISRLESSDTQAVAVDGAQRCPRPSSFSPSSPGWPARSICGGSTGADARRPAARRGRPATSTRCVPAKRCSQTRSPSTSNAGSRASRCAQREPPPGLTGRPDDQPGASKAPHRSRQPGIDGCRHRVGRCSPPCRAPSLTKTRCLHAGTGLLEGDRGDDVGAMAPPAVMKEGLRVARDPSVAMSGSSRP